MRRAIGLGALIALVIVCSRAEAAQQDSRRKGKDGDVAALHNQTGNGVKPVSATEDPLYVIGEDDVLNIDVWKEPEISRTVPVRPDGRISLPLINDVQAVGLTPSQLANAVTERLRKYLNDPQVTVIVTQIRSRHFYIVGEVARTGSFDLLQNMTVLQALSAAGGFTQFANLKRIYVLRSENGRQVKLPFNYKEVIRGQKREQNIPLRPGDTIVVP